MQKLGSRSHQICILLVMHHTFGRVSHDCHLSRLFFVVQRVSKPSLPPSPRLFLFFFDSGLWLNGKPLCFTTKPMLQAKGRRLTLRMTLASGGAACSRGPPGPDRGARGKLAPGADERAAPQPGAEPSSPRAVEGVEAARKGQRERGGPLGCWPENP